MASKYPQLFSNKLGCKDTEEKLEVDVRPDKQPLRQVAFHYRDAVQKVLEKQVSEGIFEKMDAKTSPIIRIFKLGDRSQRPQANAGRCEAPMLVAK